MKVYIVVAHVEGHLPKFVNHRILPKTDLRVRELFPLADSAAPHMNSEKVRDVSAKIQSTKSFPQASTCGTRTASDPMAQPKIR